jgi:metallophosphoesterase (TIGR00282 family)
VINASGRVFLPALDCPFQKVNEIVMELKDSVDYIIVDFHAEATSEKVALGRFLDGRVTAVLGTHTHIQTADERILPGGTGYITDLGMTGPYDSILGVDKDIIIQKFLTGRPARFEVATGPTQMEGVIIDVDDDCNKVRSIERFCLFLDD